MICRGIEDPNKCWWRRGESYAEARGSLEVEVEGGGGGNRAASYLEKTLTKITENLWLELLTKQDRIIHFIELQTLIYNICGTFQVCI